MSGGGQTTTQKVDPWKPAQPFILEGMERSEDLYNQGPQTFFPGETVAPFAPESELAFNATAARALDGSPLNAAAGRYTQDVLGGQYLEQGNPYLDRVFGNIQSRVLPSVMAAYEGAGRSPGGAGLYADTAARAMTEAFAPFAYGDYAGERGRMDEAARFAPGLAREDYVDTGALAGVGGQRQRQLQAMIDAEMARYNFGQQAPYNQLASYIGSIGGLPMGQQTVTKGPGTDPFSALGSTALSAAALYSMFQ